MKRTTKQNITFALENILQVLALVAGVSLLISLMIMVENWKITTAPLIISIASIVYLLSIWAYTYLINK